jgi:hypothetical protein
MRRGFMSAYEVGERYAIRNIRKYTNIEEIIIDAMITNPYQGEKARKSYIVSEWVNTVARRRTRIMIYGE